MLNQVTFDSFIQQFLNQEIISTSIVYLDYWSLVHLMAGVLLGIFLAVYYRSKKTWLYALLILATYEVLELFLNGILFIPETPLDTTWDLIIGPAGFFIGQAVIKKFPL